MSKVKREVNRLAEMLATIDPCDPRYATVATQLERLTKSDANENGWKGPTVVNAIGVAINAGISGVTAWGQMRMLLKHEDRGNVVGTKALGFVKKPK